MSHDPCPQAVPGCHGDCDHPTAAQKLAMLEGRRRISRKGERIADMMERLTAKENNMQPTNEARVKTFTIEEKIEQLVSYHKPDEAGINAISEIRKATASLILAIVRNCPQNADRSAAIRRAREAMMTANASIVVPQVQL